MEFLHFGKISTFLDYIVSICGKQRVFECRLMLMYFLPLMVASVDWPCCALIVTHTFSLLPSKSSASYMRPV